VSAPGAPETTPARRSRAWLYALGALLGAIVVLAVLYATGSFDRTLYPLGLNAHECARDRGGSVLCGSQLEAQRARLRQIRREEARLEVEREAERARQHAERVRELHELEHSTLGKPGEPQAEAERGRRALAEKVRAEIEAEG